MSRQIQIRRGTAAQHANFTGVIGEVTMDTTNKTLRVHDGVTQGGNEIVSLDKFYSYTTNCIIDILNDIKLELNQNGITLKSGSKFYVPQQDGSFVKNTVSTDVNISGGWGSRNEQQFLIRLSGGSWTVFPIQYCQSGDSVDTTRIRNDGFGIWYDTTHHLVKWTTDSGNTWSGGCSLPVAIVTETTNSNLITKIDQIFNGFGFIGSTVFALPGVKGLIPNGKKTDNTSKNTSWTTSSVVINTFSGTANEDVVFNGDTFGHGVYHLNHDNYLCNSNNTLIDSTVVGTLHITNGVIDSFVTKDVFKFFDYNDTDFIAHQMMPSDRYINLTLGATGSTYIAPADGYITLLKGSGATGEWAAMIHATSQLTIGVYPPSGMNGRLFMPVSKGDIITVNYTLSGTTGYFRFVYANGTK